MKIAIIGAGFCGLAIACHIYNKYPDAKVTFYDPHGIGGATSGMAAGFLHPFSGAHAKLNRFGKEGMSASKELIELSSLTLGASVIAAKGVVRTAVTKTQQDDFLICKKKFPQ